MAVRKKIEDANDETVRESVAETPMSVTTTTIGSDVEIVVSRSFKVNMGNYESADSFVSAKITVPIGHDLEAVSSQMGEIIDTLQGPDLELFKSLTREPKSIAHKLIP